MLVASDEVDLDEPVYTRNGASVTFVAGTSLRSIPATGVGSGELGTVLVDGSESYHNPSNPAWSPDGSTLLFGPVGDGDVRRRPLHLERQRQPGQPHGHLERLAADGVAVRPS